MKTLEPLDVGVVEGDALGSKGDGYSIAPLGHRHNNPCPGEIYGPFTRECMSVCLRVCVFVYLSVCLSMYVQYM